MKLLALLLLCVVLTFANAQDSLVLTPGKPAPSFLIRNGNTLQSVSMPYQKKIVLLNFWSSTDVLAGLYNRWLKNISTKYRNAGFRNADGFEVIAIGVQTNKTLWEQTIQEDSLGVFTNFLATKGYSEDVCIKYSVSKIPTLILIDEDGLIVEVDPTMLSIERFLDQKKNSQLQRKTISGLLAQSSNRADALKFSKVYLFSIYGDSLAKTTTNEKGIFVFDEVLLGHDYVLKLDNKIDINTSDPIALYTTTGTFINDGRTRDEGFLFSLGSRLCNKLVSDTVMFTSAEGLDQIDVIKSLSFAAEGASLTVKDQREIQPILARLKSNPKLLLELVTHTDARLDPQEALELTSRQANTLRDFFQANGISPTRIKAVARGNSELRKRCDGTIDCREEDHRLNRRVEFLVYKD